MLLGLAEGVYAVSMYKGINFWSVHTVFTKTDLPNRRLVANMSVMRVLLSHLLYHAHSFPAL